MNSTSGWRWLSPCGAGSARWFGVRRAARPAGPGRDARPALAQPGTWLAAVAASPLLGAPPVLHLEGDLLYLDRYWLEERQVAADVLALAAVRPPGAVPDIDRLFPDGYEEQRRAAEVALSQGLTVLTGGPGTGKTTTVARLLALLAEQAELEGSRARGSRWPHRPARRLPVCRKPFSSKSMASDPPIVNACRVFAPPHCIGCWAAGRTPRHDSATTVATGCPTTSSWSTRRRWCR